MTMFGSQWLANAGSTYEIEQSIRFNDNDSPYLTRTPDAAGTEETWTYSSWVKLGNIGLERSLFEARPDSDSYGFIRISSDDKVVLSFNDDEAAHGTMVSTRLLRDPSAWYNIVVVADTTNSTAGERLRVYVNGERLTSWDTETYPSQNSTLYGINWAVPQQIGNSPYSAQPFDGYMAEINFIDGVQKAASDFGEYNDDGVWIPKAYSGAYGTNGFYLKGQDSSALGDDTSGNGNDFTSSGLAAADQMLDTPTDNFPTFSNNIRGLESYGPSTLTWGNGVDISDGGLKVLGASSGSNLAGATMAFPTSGKYYFEATFIGADTSYFGISPLYDESKIVWYRNNGWTLQNATSWTTSGGATYTDTDVLAVSVNMDDLEAKFYKNNALQITISLTAGVEYIPTGRGGNSSLGYTFNFGASAFTYTPPTGFVALSTANLPTPTIADGSAYFQTTLYTGTGSALEINQTGNNSTFQPDMVWAKSRSSAQSHRLADVIRGSAVLFTDTTAAEDTTAGISFDADGFSWTNSDGSNANDSSVTYAAWQWKAGGSGSSNEDGSINTTATSVNTTAGFSMSTYTGTGSNATVGHGLGVTPSVVLIMPRSNGDHKIISNWADGVTAFTEKLLLDTNQAADSTGTTQLIGGSSTTFSLGTDTNVNGSSRTYVGYCWAEVEGFSKMGTYFGNGSADGPFNWCGFRPAFILVKEESSADDWLIYDAARDPYNVAGRVLRPDTSAAEFDGRGGSRDVDFLSNGFKFRSSNATMNGNGVTYIFMAFAEHPFGGDGVAPATAR